MPPSRKLQVASWALYDFANTIFSMNMLSMYFPLWVTQDMGGRDIYYGIGLSISTLAAGLTMPVIGVISDQKKKRVPFLIGLTLLCVTFTASISLSGSLAAAIIIFAVANYGYQAALAPYDALLPEVSRGRNIGWVSGFGVALGYVGSIGGLYMVKPFVAAHGRSAAFIPTAVLFLLFALPAFIFVKDSHARPRAGKPDIARGYRRIKYTLMNTRRYPGLLRFLVANMVYSDAVNTVIVFMGVYASKVIGMGDESLRAFLSVSTVSAVVGSYGIGHVTGKFGPKRTLVAVLFLWLFTLVLAGLSMSRAAFWAVGPLAGISLGGTWVSSRTLVAELTPPRKFGEVYGLYNLGGKFGFVVGPLVWGGIILVFEPLGMVRYRIAIFSLAVFIAAALWLLRKVPGRNTLNSSPP